MAGPFYFAWVDPTDTTWSPSFARDDEDIFSFRIEHAEGDFATLEATIRNPRVGLLASGRKQWAWLSYQAPNEETATPLFFGRVLGVPQNLEEEGILITLVARPADYEEVKAALADTLRDLPWFDPIWFLDEEHDDPDKVLEARTALWHVDRVTHAVTVSDILVDEEGAADVVPQDTVIRDSLEVTYSTSPARKVILEAEVAWNQRGTGELDLTQEILNEFAAATPASVNQFGGGALATQGQINILGGDQLADSWPSPDRGIGGGWRVGQSSLELVGPPPMLPTSYSPDIIQALLDADPADQGRRARAEGIYETIRDVFGRTPGYLLQVINHSIEDQEEPAERIDLVWIPIWRMAPTFTTRWEADRSRTETVRFEMTADVQPLLADPGEEEIIYLNLGPAYVDEVIEEPLARSYFKTERGRHSIANLLARARAALLARARAVDISFETSFDYAVGLSCRHNLAVSDERLPGGIAAGKVKSYSLVVDGDSGEMFATVVIGATVGRGGSVTPSAGTPVWAEEDYVAPGYQVYMGTVALGPAGDVAFSGVDEVEIEDDGQDLLNVTLGSHLLDIGVSGGLSTQESQLQVDSPYPNTVHIIDRINAVTTEVWVEMLPVTGGPFLTHYDLTVTDLVVPATIDLEAS